MDDSLWRPLLVLLAVLGGQRAQAWSARRHRDRGSSWNSKGVIANVRVSPHGQTGMYAVEQSASPSDLGSAAAQTFAQYEHYDARAPQHPVSLYQEFRLQQQHPVSGHAEPPTTTFAPAFFSEQMTLGATAHHESPSHTAPSPHTPETTTTSPKQHSKMMPSLAGDDIHHELQMQLSQQIQVQLEQLQKLHELQTKMLKAPKATEAPQPSPPPPPQSAASPPLALQQGSEHVSKEVMVPNRDSNKYRQHSTPLPVTYAPTLIPAATTLAPPVDMPRYPEESQPLTSFIEEPPSAPVGGAISNGFQPIPPPAGPRRPAPDDGMEQTLDAGLDFQPFTEDATDPALPFYLLPPAQESGSHYHHDLGEDDDGEGPSGASTSSELIDHAYMHSVRGKHRLRPSR